MLRRSHKKSRAGCLECKRRHVKCDEQRPKCIICTLSERACSYPPGTPPAPAGSSQGSRQQHRQQKQQLQLQQQLSQLVSPSPSADRSSSTSSGGSTGSSPQHNAPHLVLGAGPMGIAAEAPLYSDVTAPVNLDHMELLIRFHVPDHFPDIDEEMLEVGTKMHHRSTLMAPYYLMETMAISARRLAAVEPERAEKMMGYAVSLQTQAISLYNHVVSTVNIDNINCVPIIQFASILGRHLIADLLARREDDFNVFMDYYLEFVKIHTGINLITHAAWPYLIDSDMKDFMIWSTNIKHTPTIGNECAPLHELVQSAGFDLATLEACSTVIRVLQISLDLCQEPPPRNRRFWTLFAWPVIAPPEFIELMVQRRPEALLAVAYFGLVLHFLRDTWFTGSAGRHIITTAARYLGPGWAAYMSYPLSVIAADPL